MRHMKLRTKLIVGFGLCMVVISILSRPPYMASPSGFAAETHQYSEESECRKNTKEKNNSEPNR